MPRHTPESEPQTEFERAIYANLKCEIGTRYFNRWLVLILYSRLQSPNEAAHILCHKSPALAMFDTKKWILFIFLTGAVCFSGTAAVSLVGENSFAMTRALGIAGKVGSIGKGQNIGSKAMDEENNGAGQTRFADEGPWGGEGIQLTVGKETSSIEYPCADGEITGRFRLNRNGTFKLNGSHIRLRPGPVRLDQKELREPSVYEGKVTGNRMTLKVTLSKNREVIGEFRLQKGVLARIRRCL